MSSGSKKPCPGCGKVKDWRRASEVCSDCKRLLERAASLEEQVGTLAADEIIISRGELDRWNEYIYTRADNDNSDKLMANFHQVAEAGSRPAGEMISEFNLLGEIQLGGGTYSVMPRPLAEAIRDLREVVVAALTAEYEAGKADGHNLLMRLADGDISSTDFDAKTGANETQSA